MELEYLYEFTVIARLRSYSRASEELCISQSSLSKHVKTLERELGGELLRRSSRSVEMTPLGAEIFPFAREVGVLNNAIRAAAEVHADREKKTLPLATLPVMAYYGITELLADFRRDHPRVSLEVTECERQELLELLSAGGRELVFARLGLEEDGEENLEELVLRRDHLTAAVSRSNPLARRDHISMKDLAEEPLLLLDQQTGFHHLYIRLFREAGFVPRIAYTGLRPENLLALAARDVGTALVMGGHGDYVAQEGVRLLDIEPRVSTAICLVRQKGRPISRLARAFWDYAAARSLEKEDVT